MQGRDKKKRQGCSFSSSLTSSLTTTRHRTANPIRQAIAERFVLPVDVVIRSSEVLAQQRDDPYSLIHKVLEEGKVLYERRVA